MVELGDRDSGEGAAEGGAVGVLDSGADDDPDTQDRVAPALVGQSRSAAYCARMNRFQSASNFARSRSPNAELCASAASPVDLSTS